MKSWRTIPIFISSTFKDMDAERDYIKYHLLGRLNRKYNPRFISFEVIDLRLGINNVHIDEAERENRVLDVCFDAIHNTRPFFIGLIGNRYGWIPNKNRWSHVVCRLAQEERRLIANGKGKSVTELEILYGAIGDTNQHLNHSLFFIRSQESYKYLPEKEKENYFETIEDDVDHPQGNDRLLKLEVLKERLRVLSEQHENSFCYEYTIDWDNEKSQFTNLDKFGDLMYEAICREVEQERVDNESIDDSWQWQENLNVEYLFTRNNHNKIVRRNLLQEILVLLEKGRSVLLCGESGCGKSVLLSQIYEQIHLNPQYVCLGSFIGTTCFSDHMLHVLCRWVFDLEKKLSLPASNLSLYSNKLEIYDKFKSLVNQCTAKCLRVVIFADGLEKLEDLSPEDSYMSWLNERIQLMATATEISARKNTMYNRHIVLYPITNFSYEESKEMLNQLSELRLMELPFEIIDDLCRRKVSPMYLGMAFNIFTNFSGEDFRQIRARKEENDVEAIYCFQKELYKKMPDNTLSLVHFYIENLTRCLKSDAVWLKSLQLIALSKIGLREGYLEQIMGDQYDSLMFHTLMYSMNDYVWENRAEHSWRFSNQLFTQAVLSNIDSGSKNKICRELIALTDNLPENDPLRERILAYLLFVTQDSGRILKHLTFELDNWFEKKEIIEARYCISLHHILHDCNFEECIRAIASNYSAQEKVDFAYSLFMYAMPWNKSDDVELWIKRCRTIVDNIPLESLSMKYLYNLGTLYKDMSLVGRNCTAPLVHTIDDWNGLLLNFSKKGAEAFIRCFNIDPKYRDCRNMAIAMATELMQSYITNVQFDKIEQTYHMITKIRNNE